LKQFYKEKKSIFLSVIAVITLLTLIVSATYAYFQASIGNSGKVDVGVETGDVDTLTFIAEDKIEFNVNVTNFGQGAGNVGDTATAKAQLIASQALKNETRFAEEDYNVFLVITSNDFEYTTESGEMELRLQVTDPNGNKVTSIPGLNYITTDKEGNAIEESEQGFDITTRTGSFLIAADWDIRTNDILVQDWLIDVTMINLDSNQNKNMGKSFNGEILMQNLGKATYEVIEINNLVETTTTYNSITTTLDVKEGTEEASKYYFGIEEVNEPTAMMGSNILRLSNNLIAGIEDVNFNESESSTYTFTDLKANTTYKIYAYALDKYKIKSNMYETEVRTVEYKIPQVESVEETSTLNGITVSVNATAGDGKVVKYLYSINDEEYIESDNSNYTFENLEDTSEYKIKIKVKDENGYESTEWMKNINTEVYVLPSITKVESSATYNSITLTTTAVKGREEIGKYWYSVNGEEFVEGSSVYTIKNLSEKTDYNIKVKVSDVNNRYSEEYIVETIKTSEYKIPSITKVETTADYESITVNVNAIAGEGKITKYLYKINEENWIEIESNTYKFSGLKEETEYEIKVKVKDENGRDSIEYSEEKTTEKYNLPIITTVDVTKTYKSIRLNVVAERGTNAISKYWYSINNGEYVEGSNIKEYGNLNEKENYTIKIYVEDSLGRKSVVKTIEETTDEYVIPSITKVEMTSDLESITVNVTASNGTGRVTKYLYSINNGSFIESEESNHKFTGLKDTTEYTIKVKVRDENGRESVEYSELKATATYYEPTIKNVTVTSKTYNSISLNVEAEKGTNEVSKYWYGVNNGEYVEGSKTYTINNLSEKTVYNIKVKVSDTKNRYSKEYIVESITTNEYILPKVTNVSVTSTSSTLTVKATTSNGDGNVVKYYYSKNNGSDWVSNTTGTYVFDKLTSEATYNIKVYVEDNNGRISSEYVTSGTTSRIVVTPTIANSTSGSNGWYKAVSISASVNTTTDSPTIKHCTTSGTTCEATSSYGGAVTLSENASARRICFQASDKEGNTSGIACSDAYKVDATAGNATFSISSSTGPTNGWYQALTIGITGSDGQSGVTSMKYCGGVSCTPSTSTNSSSATQVLTNNASSQQVCATVTNGAGMTSEKICSSEYKVDTENPSVGTPQIASSTGPTNGWYQAVSIKATGSDTASGVASMKYCTTTGTTCNPTSSTNETSATVSIPASTNGYRACFIAVDTSGRTTQTPVCSGLYKVDSEVPTISNVTATSTTDSITVSVSASDSQSQVATYYYKIGSGSYESSTSSTKTFSGLNVGTSYTITVYVVDNAGRQSKTATTSETTDMNKQTLTFLSDWYDADSNSFLTNCQVQYSTDAGGSWKNITMPASGTVDLPIGAQIRVKSLVNAYGDTKPEYDICGIYIGYSYTLRYDNAACAVAAEFNIYSYTDENSSTIHTLRATDTHYAMTYATCLVGDTELYVLSKKKKRKKKIKDIKVGDKVYVLDDNGKEVAKTVKRVYENIVSETYKIKLSTGEIIECTPKHHFMVKDLGLMYSNELQVGYKLQNIDNEYIEVIDIINVKHVAGIKVYNLEFEDGKTNIYAIGTTMILSLSMIMGVKECQQEIIGKENIKSNYVQAIMMSASSSIYCSHS